MKKVILSAIVLAGCTGNNSSKMKEFIPGVYTRHFEAQYSAGDDTLFITQLNGSATYNVIRKSTYRRIKNRMRGEREQKVESWTVLYNDRDNNLYEQKRQRLLTPIPDSNKLLVGNSAYLKIK